MILQLHEQKKYVPGVISVMPPIHILLEFQGDDGLRTRHESWDLMFCEAVIALKIQARMWDWGHD